MYQRLVCLSFIIVFLLVLVLIPSKIYAQDINIKVNHKRVNIGDTVKITIEVNSNEKPMAELLIPPKGVINLKLKSEKASEYTSEFIINNESSNGLYVITSWTGNKLKPSAVGKGYFLYKKIIGDFCIIPIFDPNNLKEDMNRYLKEVMNFGDNLLVLHNIIGKQAYYKSRICKKDSTSETDEKYLGTMLDLCDKEGIAVLISAMWDATRDIPYPERTASTKKIIKELYQVYGTHPSLAGFYTYQEGSGTYMLPFLRKFCRFVKSLDPGLLTAAAPYMDDALLAGYLSTIKDLDIIIYQGMIMASYRPDNRRAFPIRYIKDFGLINTGAKKLQDKISLTHIETFAYDTNKVYSMPIADYNTTYQQILSAATVPDNDGITIFTYGGINYILSNRYPQKKEVINISNKAIDDGMKAFKIIGQTSQKPNQLALYYPWADWRIARWDENYYSAPDAFRVLGSPVDVLPYAPPLNESYLPYYPYHENPDVLHRILKNKKVLVFPNIYGFYQTDSDLIKDFVEQGGKIIAFGPEIPTGVSYGRNKVFGLDELYLKKTHSKIILKNSLAGRTHINEEWEVKTVSLPVWKISTAKVLAEFEDGSAAIVINKFGKGEVVSISADVKTAAQYFPALIRDLFDYIDIKRDADIVGTNENTDISLTSTKDGFKAAIVNYNDNKITITVKPLYNLSENNSEAWIDMVSNKNITVSNHGNPLKITIPPHNFRAIEMKIE